MRPQQGAVYGAACGYAYPLVSPIYERAAWEFAAKKCFKIVTLKEGSFDSEPKPVLDGYALDESRG